MPLTMGQVSHKNFKVECIHLDTPTISITSELLDILGYEGATRSKLGRGKKPSEKELRPEMVKRLLKLDYRSIIDVTLIMDIVFHIVAIWRSNMDNGCC